MSEFLAMGGHGAYVWSAYGITLIVLAVNAWTAVRRHSKAIEAARARRTFDEAPRQAKVTHI